MMLMHLTNRSGVPGCRCIWQTGAAFRPIPVHFESPVYIEVPRVWNDGGSVPGGKYHRHNSGWNYEDEIMRLQGAKVRDHNRERDLPPIPELHVIMYVSINMSHGWDEITYGCDVRAIIGEGYIPVVYGIGKIKSREFGVERIVPARVKCFRKV